MIECIKKFYNRTTYKVKHQHLDTCDVLGDYKKFILNKAKFNY